MKVTLAYPYRDHEPDTTVELPDEEALRLVRDGQARVASKFVSAEKVETKSSGEKS